jgi:hypothetical protein
MNIAPLDHCDEQNSLPVIAWLVKLAVSSQNRLINNLRIPLINSELGLLRIRSQ